MLPRFALVTVLAASPLVPAVARGEVPPAAGASASPASSAPATQPAAQPTAQPATIPESRQLAAYVVMAASGVTLAAGAITLAFALFAPSSGAAPYWAGAGVTLGVGGAGMITGLVLLVVPPKKSPLANAAITPVLAPGYVGLAGRF